jgi:MYXO-CTERM domain-containing protein
VELGEYNSEDEADYCAGSWTDTSPPWGECIGVSTDGTDYDRLAHLTENEFTPGIRHELSLDATDYTGGTISFYIAESDNYPYDWDGLLVDDFTVICGETLCDDGLDNDGDGDADCDEDSEGGCDCQYAEPGTAVGPSALLALVLSILVAARRRS